MKPSFITDFGAPQILKAADGSDSYVIPRYGVWARAFMRSPTVIATGSDLASLQSDYRDGSVDLPVLKFPEART